MCVNTLSINLGCGDECFSKHRRDPPDDPRAGQEHDRRAHDLYEHCRLADEVDLHQRQVNHYWSAYENEQWQGEAHESLKERPRVAAPAGQARDWSQ